MEDPKTKKEKPTCEKVMKAYEEVKQKNQEVLKRLADA